MEVALSYLVRRLNKLLNSNRVHIKLNFTHDRPGSYQLACQYPVEMTTSCSQIYLVIPLQIYGWMPNNEGYELEQCWHDKWLKLELILTKFLGADSASTGYFLSMYSLDEYLC